MTCKYNNWVRPTIYQAMYNCITRSVEPELIPACRRYGIDFVVYNPIAGGLLTGKIKSVDDIPTEGRFSDESVVGSMYRERYYRDSTFKALQTIQEACDKEGVTMKETALRWVVHHSKLNIKGEKANDGIIIGVSSLEQLEGNLEDLQKGPLPESVVEAVEKAWLLAKADTTDYWHMDIDYKYDTVKELFG